jgi:predicted homoserine dehydrogenase-like protein
LHGLTDFICFLKEFMVKKIKGERENEHMIYQNLFDPFYGKKIVRAGIIGTGYFGTAIVTQATKIPLLEVPAVADLNIEAAKSAYRQAGIPDGDMVVCDSRAAALQAMDRGKYVITENALLLMDLPLDVIVESTGAPTAGALHAYEAIRGGKHVVMVTKETDATVGPILKHMADHAGLIYTPVDGDHPGLVMGLVSWARSIGLEVLCGGKSRDSRNEEFVHDQSKRTVACGGKAVTLEEKDLWILNPIPAGQTKYFVQSRKEILGELPQITMPDVAEMAIAANATGLMPDIESLHYPILHTHEIPEVLCLVEDGGILHTRGAIEEINCFRQSHEAGMGGGVFVVVSCENEYSRMILTQKGLMHNSKSSTALIYRPYHLLGVEAPISILCAALLRITTGATKVSPLIDVVAKATRKMAAGEVVDDGPISNVEPLLRPAVKVAHDVPLPFYMIYRNRLSKDIAPGMVITRAMVTEPPNSMLWRLRKEQDLLSW